MKTFLTIGLLMAAGLTASPLSAFADGDDDVAPTPFYVRGPRIIHVPRT